MALALYRKYRPRTFAEVIGQEHVTEPLSQALRSGRLHHAYLFSGPRGCGKTSSARILARSLNCEQGPTPDPCGVCASCRSLMNDGTGSIDVIEIDAASHGGVDDARELREKAFFAPASSRYKIYVIDEAHMVSSAGFNALLKLVEEPPDYVKFIFATTEPEKVLGTIRSRTHHYPFRLIPPAVLRPYLQQLTEAEGVHVEPAVLPLVVRAGGGSARDSLSVLDQLIAGAGPEGVSYTRAVALLGVTDVALIDEMCDALAAGDGAAAYATIDRVAEAGHDPRRFASDLLERFRDLIILQQVPDAVTKGLIDGPADQLDAMSAQATRLGPATLSRCADIVHNGLVEMRGTTAPRLLLELITARMLLPGADDTTGALLQRLERMERRLTLTSEPETGPAAPGTSSAPPTSQHPEGTPGVPVPGGGGISAARAAASAAARRGAADSSGAGAAADESPRQPTATGAEATGPGVAAGPDASPGDGSASGGEPGSAAQEERRSSTEDPLGHRARPGGAVSPGLGDAAAGGPGQPVPPQARRPEPTAVLPDAPEELPAETTPGPGQLTAAAVREVWPEIISDVGRKSKKVAALASGATVRDLDGQTVVLTFRFPAHAKMVGEQPHLIVDALYEALGGRWQIRCEVAGEAGGTRGDGGAPPRDPSAPTQAGPVQAGPVQAGPAAMTSAHSVRAAAPTRQPEASPPDDGDGDDWPEPAKPGGLPAGSAASVSDRGVASGPARALSSGTDARPPRGAGAETAPAAGRVGNGAPSSGLAAARAAAAAGAARLAGAKPAVAQATPVDAWSDGSPTEEAPYDPEYDGPPRAGSAASAAGSVVTAAGSAVPPASASFEGFDPGDEPLDDVIDEKTARQSSEQQAMQLLQDAFGAEKISEG